MGKKIQPRSALHNECSEPQRQRLKIGLILEGTVDGPDKKVCEYLVQRLQQETEVVSITLRDKPNLIARCGETAALLLNENCQRVVIVWDLYPPWRKGEKPCRRKDREAIFRSLQEAGVASKNVYLVCIREELEAWLIADDRAIAKAISRLTGRQEPRIAEVRKPDSVSNPKERLIKIFKQHTRHQYQGHVHAIKIVRELESLSLNKIKRSDSFKRFALKATDTKL